MERAKRSDAERQVEVKAGTVVLQGTFDWPEPRGVIVFAHRSGNGRLNPRNVMMAKLFKEAGFATLMVDLLQPDEAQVLKNIFDIRLLTDRLLAATEWVMQQPGAKGLRIGYMATSNGTAAALQAAARMPDAAAAVVSRGGRPDLARSFLSQVRAPTLLLVGENDPTGVEQNQKACEQLTCQKELLLIPGASHLFEEPGTFEQAASQARAWFLRYVGQD